MTFIGYNTEIHPEEGYENALSLGIRNIYSNMHGSSKKGSRKTRLKEQFLKMKLEFMRFVPIMKRAFLLDCNSI